MGATRILGIDPGLGCTGYGVLEKNRSVLAYVASGRIRSDDSLPLAERLAQILAGLSEVIESYEPVEVAVEKVFVNVNPQSTLLLGQARGAAICAAVLARLPVAEYTALQMKKAVVGHGLATKAQIQSMVARLLGLAREPGKDAADALGLAITHAHAAGAFAAMARSGSLARKAHAQYKRGRTY